MGAWGDGIWGSDTAVEAKTAFYRNEFGSCSNLADLLSAVREQFGSAGVLSVAKIFVETADTHRLQGEPARMVEEAVEEELKKLTHWVEPDKRREALRDFTESFNEGLDESESIDPAHDQVSLV